MTVTKEVLYNIHLTNSEALIWRLYYFKISVKVSVTFTSLLMSNQPTKRTTKFPLELMGISIFLKTGMVKILETLHRVLNVKALVFQITMF